MYSAMSHELEDIWRIEKSRAILAVWLEGKQHLTHKGNNFTLWESIT
jgi:hypothetical protein